MKEEDDTYEKALRTSRQAVFDVGRRRAFFYLGDRAWELFRRLSKEEADDYLSVRAKQGVNAIQAVALAEFDGLSKPNIYGRYPLKKDPGGGYASVTPDLDGDYSYWGHVDAVVKLAEKYGLFVTLLPTWGISSTNAGALGRKYLPRTALMAAGWAATGCWKTTGTGRLSTPWARACGKGTAAA